MPSTSIDRKAETGKGEVTRTRSALALWRERGEEFSRDESCYWLVRVPSRTQEDLFYEVDLLEETCDCPDHARGGNICAHIIAATIFAAKSPRREGAVEPRPKRKPSRFSGDWTADIPSDEAISRIGASA